MKVIRNRGARRVAGSTAAVLAATLAVAACGSSSKSSSSSSANSGAGNSGSASSSATSTSSGSTNTATPQSGGSFTMLEQAGLTGTWPTGLDPATDTTGSDNQSALDSIYGNLFELGAGGKTIPDLATGYQIADGGKKVTIDLRPGVKFSDGSALTSSVVQWNFERDLKSAVGDNPHWPVSSITTAGKEKVIINLKTPYAPIINSMHDANVNWIASEAAYKKMGENAFKLKPVGAGPFVVTADNVSNDLSLKKNPTYWKQGQPYLNTLSFKTVASDEAALEDMQSGTGDGYEGLQTPSLVSQFQKKFNVLNAESTSPYVIQLNTAIAPFNNIKAREATYYATDVAAIDTKLFGNLHPIVESFTAPNGLFYQPKVPGYRTYDLAKAKALVKSIPGGVTVNLDATQSSVTQTVLEALQQMWEAAGMKVKINVALLPTVIQNFESKKWQAYLQTAGAYDPAAGLGVAFRFGSASPFSGVHDPKLDALLAKGVSTINMAKRKQVYDEAGEYISKMAYAPFMFPVDGWNIAVKNAVGPGLTTLLPASAVRPEILWAQVGFTSGS